MQKTKEEKSQKKPHECINEEKPMLDRNIQVRDKMLADMKVIKDKLTKFKEEFFKDKEEDVKKSFDFHTCEDDNIRIMAKTFAKLKQNLHQMEEVISQQECNMICWKVQQEVDGSQELRDKLALKT